ncbi:MAG: DedA family protein [Caldibacillus debilis]|jgi:membrane protein DedA with SNARE-associated domain|uniref:Alkaline phosphatase n=2 Tax=Caldibacillus debilis TaxID=301148 RepID=A0A150MF53_9BACI|nr:DedA family protein [Caldibacillus debilis]MBO2481664.1 DedA family protein [Bacillaceae bacterium]KYD22902.1 Alkaline phosphatase [Caldibacillus debilis]MBY6272475.1 DedA family protein [Bacillaceae bacterium]REJ17269.1 MAG: DedA family protein [Caldibacillus debilis]REJ30135.1 MAG: DedA family protein [Caldibacillus debilis]
MENWITQVMEQYGYLGVFLLICLENLFPPIPSEVILTFGGFMTAVSQLSFFGVLISATLGSLAGAVLLYGIGLLLEVNRLENFVDRYEKILRISKTDLRRAGRWFEKYGYWTVFFCRMVPVLRSVISIPAGMTKMHFGLFLLFTTAGTLIWNALLVGLGAKLGENWERIVHYMDIYSNFVYAVIIIAAVLFLIYLFRRKRR